MKALLKKTPAPGAAFESVADLTLKPDEVLVKVHRASICGSDLPIYGWTSWAPERFKTPSTFGHEFCGTIEEIGADDGQSVVPPAGCEYNNKRREDWLPAADKGPMAQPRAKGKCVRRRWSKRRVTRAPTRHESRSIRVRT